MPLRPVPVVCLVVAGSLLGAPVAGAPRVSGTPDPRRALTVYADPAPPQEVVDGVAIGGSAYGSSFVAKPGTRDVFYGLTDRGPNVDAPDGHKVEPRPQFQPAIAEFRLTGGRMVRLHTIGLRATDGSPIDGRVNTAAGTGETIEDRSGRVLAKSPNGYDPEGLVAMPDGSFWVSDEYGPYVSHFDRHGRQVSRLSPASGLPRELASREPNRGMEGLTVTPDGRTLVGIMQSALDAPDGPKAKKVSALRIVTVDLRTRSTHEYVYLLHNTTGADTSVSEIAALNGHEFLVDERDGDMEPGANKKLFRIDLRGATDVGPHTALKGATYDSAGGGLLLGGKTVEAVAGKQNTVQAAASLRAAGVTPVSSHLYLDYAGLVSAVDPSGGFFGHDKVEGVAVRGRYVYLSNDSDFGIAGVTNTTPPWKLEPKRLPNGTVDSGQVLRVDMARVPAAYRG